MGKTNNKVQKIIFYKKTLERFAVTLNRVYLTIDLSTHFQIMSGFLTSSQLHTHSTVNTGKLYLEKYE